LPVLCEIGLQRAEITRMVTVGIDDETVDTLTGTLLRMKLVLIQEAHAARRGADPAEVPHAEVEAPRGVAKTPHRIAEATELA